MVACSMYPSLKSLYLESSTPVDILNPIVLKEVKQSKTINKYLRIDIDPPPSFIGSNADISLTYIFNQIPTLLKHIIIENLQLLKKGIIIKMYIFSIKSIYFLFEML